MPRNLPLPSSESRRQPGPAVSSLQDAAVLEFVSDRQPWQRSLRWEEPPRNRRRLLLGLAFALFITVLEIGGFALGMRSYRGQPTPRAAHQEMQIVRIEAITQPLPPPPEPEPPPFERRPSRVTVAPPEVKTTPPPPRPAEDSEAMRARIGAAAPQVQLFNPDGSVRLGETPMLAPKAAPRNAHEAGKAKWAEIEKRANPLGCRKTRFADAFRTDESVGDEVSRKYLKWIGLHDAEATAHRAEQRRQRADENCDPAQ